MNPSKEIKSLLWATDFSEESRFCLPHLEFFAKTLKTQNHALYVLPRFSDWIYETAFLSDDELLKTIEKTRQQSEDKIIQYSDECDIDIQPAVVEGRITSEEIVKFAKKNKVDLIFAGRRGISELEQIVIGSTTSRLIRNSNIPVMIVPGGSHEGRVRRILCPIDFSIYSMMELEYSISLAKQLKARLFVTHISEFFNYKVPVFKRDKLIGKINEKIANVAKAHEYKIENIIYDTGEPAQKIIEIATNEKIDLLVMATHQRKGIEKLFLGSITEKVLVCTDIPVIALPPL